MNRPEGAALVLIHLIAWGNVHAGEEGAYLKPVRDFANTVLEHGRDSYGKEHTPLFVDGLHVETLEPATWQ